MTGGLSGAVVGSVLLILLAVRELMEASGGPVAVKRANELWPLTRILLIVFTLLMLDRFLNLTI